MFALPLVRSIHASIHTSIADNVVRYSTQRNLRQCHIYKSSEERRGGATTTNKEKSEMVIEEIVVAKGRQFS